MKNIQEVVNLYKSFDKYRNYSQDEIFLHILPSIKLKQYKIHRDKQGIYGFQNWAYLDDVEQESFIRTHEIYHNAWNSGNNIWHVDLVATRNVLQIADWTKQYFTQLLGCNKKVKWLRMYDDKTLQKHVYTKRHFV